MSMSSFEEAVNYVLKNEGGLEENSSDPGGITNFGISLRFLRSIKNPNKYGPFGESITEDDIRHMTVDQAKGIYRGEFWNNAPFDQIENQPIANYVFDTAVNFGIAPAIKCAQRACWAFLKNRSYIAEDGILGPHTIETINRYGFCFLAVLRAERAAYYKSKVDHNPILKEFLIGWLNRSYGGI